MVFFLGGRKRNRSQVFHRGEVNPRTLSRFEEDEYLEEEKARDSDESVKVALIAIERSHSAWKLLSELRLDNADSINGLLLDLEKLRLLAEKEFPEARDFIRPGFGENLDKLHQAETRESTVTPVEG